MAQEISFGALFKQFRKAYKYNCTQAELAGQLDYSVETIRSWELGRRFPSDNDVPRLARLMGLDAETVQHAIQIGRGNHSGAGSGITYAHSLEAYEGILTLAWETYYTSSPQRSARTVEYCLADVKQAISTSRGVLRDQLQAFYCRFLQLGGVIARDRLDLTQSFYDSNTSVNLAIELENAELMASALYRRAKIYLEQLAYQLAIHDLERALPYANRSRDPLRCYVSISLAEVYSLLSPGDKQLQRKSLFLLDQVESTVRKSNVLQGDGSFAKVDIPGLHMIRGDVLRRFCKLQDAEQALAIAHRHLPPEFTRWQGNLLISQSMLCYARKDAERACQLALDALTVIRATQSRSNRAKIEQLCQNLRATKSPSIVRVLEKELGLAE